jgi:hypothetical protein
MPRRSFISVSAATLLGGPTLLRAQAPTIDADWAAMSRAARDSAYNCGKAVPDSAQIVDRWIKASAEFRAQNPKHIDLAYGPGERNKWLRIPRRRAWSLSTADTGKPATVNTSPV